MASGTDKITDTRNAARPVPARVSTNRTAGGAQLDCDDLTGWPTASKVHFVTYTPDINDEPVAGTQCDWEGIRSGNSITGLTLNDGTDGGNLVNDIVEMLPTAAWGQDLAEALSETLNRDGTLKDDIVGSANIAAGAVGASEIASGAVGSDEIADGSIQYADLLATIFSGQIQSYTPTVTNTTGGTWTGATGRYINLGGLKVSWGRIAFISNGSANGRATVTLPPANFFTTVTYASPSIESEGNYAFQTASGDSVVGSPPATFGFYVNNTGASGSCALVWLIIGT